MFLFITILYIIQIFLAPLIVVRNRPLNKTEESQAKRGEMDDRTIMSATLPSLFMKMYVSDSWFLTSCSPLDLPTYTWKQERREVKDPLFFMVVPKSLSRETETLCWSRNNWVSHGHSFFFTPHFKWDSCRIVEEGLSQFLSVYFPKPNFHLHAVNINSYQILILIFTTSGMFSRYMYNF